MGVYEKLMVAEHVPGLLPHCHITLAMQEMPANKAGDFLLVSTDFYMGPLIDVTGWQRE